MYSVYTQTHIYRQHEDFICLLCLLITENKTVQKINKLFDIEKKVFGVNFLYFRYETLLQEAIIALCCDAVYQHANWSKVA